MRVALYFCAIALCLLSQYCCGLVFPLNHRKTQANTLRGVLQCYLCFFSSSFSAAGPIVFPIQGSINQYAEFFINVSIGSPPQILRLQVDTGISSLVVCNVAFKKLICTFFAGSTDMVVFGTHCSGCPKADNVTYLFCL